MCLDLGSRNQKWLEYEKMTVSIGSSITFKTLSKEIHQEGPFCESNLKNFKKFSELIFDNFPENFVRINSPKGPLCITKQLNLKDVSHQCLLFF